MNLEIKNFLKNKNILILGLGKSGISVIKKLASLPVNVFGMDNNPYIDIESNLAEIEKTKGVTGTNGKTTVVTLIEKILEEASKKAVVCGNIGNPLIDTIDRRYSGDTIRVIEISSFQLERIYSFKPHIAVVLNITNDHMDRHYTMDNYVDTKFKIFSNLDGFDWGIFNIDDSFISKKLQEKNFYS